MTKYRGRKLIKYIPREGAKATVQVLNKEKRTFVYFWDDLAESSKRAKTHVGLYRIPNDGYRESEG